jgi:transcriptional/translational regulatory protein YebC/TACO1
MFEKKGILVIDREDPKANKLTEDDVMLAAVEAGAEDVRVNDDSFEIITAPVDFGTVHTAVADALGVEFEVAEITMISKTTVDLSEKDEDTLQRLVSGLEDLDDVQNVYTNS